ncbi:MAG: DNA-binding response regulator [Acidobacteria bacterium]|nr:MAG: DNA-binding response regulator [Acidobacteriota bacterium]
MAPFRILLADDHEVVRAGLRALLEEQTGWEVVAEAADGRDAVDKASKLKPDAVVIDIAMPSLNGLEAVRQIMKAVPDTKVLVLTMYDSDPLIQQVLQAGARGYLLKSDAGRDLVSAIDALRRNKTFFTPKVSQMVLEGYLDKSPREKAAEGEPESLRLTSRQREIVQLLAEGKSSKEVAAVLGLSVKTAETHRANIMRKLDCHSVTELVRYAIRNHIIAA